MIRELELEFENKYKEIYNQREKFINGKLKPDQDLIKEFDERAKDLKDENYEKLDIGPIDVKAMQNSEGVSDFWLKAILAHPLG